MSQWEALIYLRIQHRPTHVVPTVLTDHRAILDALRKRDLDEVIMLHRTINQRVSEEMKEALRVQAAVSSSSISTTTIATGTGT
jgi:DNA-binding FadR family transcriptional regulator